MIVQKMPYFIKIGKIYQTRDNNFYALQQDYLINGKVTNRNYHISVAYRLYKPFTKEEINIANLIYNNELVKSDSLVISVYDCNNENCKLWKSIK